MMNVVHDDHRDDLLDGSDTNRIDKTMVEVNCNRDGHGSEDDVDLDGDDQDDDVDD